MVTISFGSSYKTMQMPPLSQNLSVKSNYGGKNSDVAKDQNKAEISKDDKNKAEILQKKLEVIVELLSNPKPKEDKTNGCIEVHQKALDDLVTVNSLFTIAVFVGLAYASPNQRSLESRPECNPDHDLAKNLIILEVNSFACFLLSSLIAKSIKVLLNIKNVRKWDQKNDHFCIPDDLSRRILLSEAWERTALGLSVSASFAGIVLLTLSMVNVIQIRVGKLTCGSIHALKAVASLCVIVLIALLFYVPSMIYAVVITRSASQNHDQTCDVEMGESEASK